ncbi:MAG: IgA Peptidase M64 [Bacteroidales bacterium]|nr:IgA Peptidase M64 [Bacteroidales bacterium]MCF8333310.1 IgA Peptidase M64 [Bacteroidales bacterium]
MRKVTILFLAIIAPLIQLFAVDFEEHFKDKTMRFDYHHTGNADEEHFAFDEIVSDGSWAGPTSQLIDTLRLGKYFFEIKDPGTGRLLYSRGYSSIYGEWETTPDAKKNWGVYHESLRFPWPKHPVDLIIYKRNANHNFEPVYNYHIKTDHYRINPASRGDYYNSYPVVENGDPHKNVDIVVLSEGYTKEEMDKFRKDAEKFAEVLLSQKPFASRKKDFNIRAVEVPSPSSGLNHPHQDIYRRSALSVSYGAFDSERYALGYNNKKIRNAASTVPYEFTVLMMNDSIYGGGGIYNLYITAAADNAFRDYLFVHEFGHHFADLADEYYTSATSYEMNKDLKEPWELNVTANPDPETLKWKELVTEGTPIPTPWGKEKYDKHSIKIQKKRNKLRKQHASEQVMEELFKKQKRWDENHLSNMKYSGHVGAFEGAQYKAKGMYRSEANCLMFTRHDEFCAACRRAIKLVIDQYTE